MNVISRRDMFRTSGVLLAAPLVGALAGNAVSQTVATGSQITNNSNSPQYSKDLEEYVTEGLAEVLAQAHLETAQHKHWVQASSLSSLYASHLKVSGVNSAFIKSISGIKPTTISASALYPNNSAAVGYVQKYDPSFAASDFSRPEMTQTNVISALTKLKTDGLSGICWKFSKAVRRHGDSSDLSGTQARAFQGGHNIQRSYYDSAVFHPAMTTDHGGVHPAGKHFGNHPRLLRIVAPNCHPKKPLTKAECQEYADYLSDELAIITGLGCGWTPAAPICAALWVIVNRILAILAKNCPAS